MLHRFCSFVLSLTLSVFASAHEPIYLFSYFIDNDQDGLHFACSKDGLQWQNFPGNPTWLTPAIGGHLMRDPCIIQGLDGSFHLVFTTSWGAKGIDISDQVRFPKGARHGTAFQISEAEFSVLIEHSKTTNDRKDS